MGEITSTSEEHTPVAIKLDELRARQKEHREDLALHAGQIADLTREIRAVGNKVMLLWWGIALLAVIQFATAVGGRLP